ncbi:MAG: 16S rRNA (guanine(966)-N(2))-methyltransferase RsmD [Acidimicrobiia bacterium]
MRVIAGTARGRRLVGPATHKTRPLTDRAREGVFSALGDWVEDADVLDLYAGSGSIGIEALSRGAHRAVFVEKSREALEALRRNLANLGFVNATVVGQDVGDYLRSASGEFHLIFFDPPWELDDEILIDQMRASARLAAEGAEMMVHRRASNPQPAVPDGWSLLSARRYGDGVIYRYERSVREQLDQNRPPST